MTSKYDEMYERMPIGTPPFMGTQHREIASNVNHNIDTIVSHYIEEWRKNPSMTAVEIEADIDEAVSVMIAGYASQNEGKDPVRAMHFLLNIVIMRQVWDGLNG